VSGAALLLAVASLLARGDGLAARAACEPATVAVGEPLRLSLEVEHDAGSDVRALLAQPLDLDASWVLLEREIEPPRPDPAHPGRSLSRAVLSIASLEPGPRSLAAQLASAFHDQRLASFDASGAHVEVTSVLAEGEDSPRPLRGLPADFGAAAAGGGRAWTVWLLAGLAALVVLAAGALVLSRRGRRARRAAPADPLAELAGFAPLSGAPAAVLRERACGLARFLRATVDRRLGRDLAGRTDGEWLRALEAAAVSPALLEGLGAFYARTESIKYAGVEPSEWALGELVASARRALELLPQPGPAGKEAA
jgi:hypothetical protein